MEIKICCPSYKKDKVKSFNFFGELLTVYVAENEYNTYIENNKKYKDNIVSIPNEIQGNVARVRNYILDRNKECDVTCIVDDDISYIGYYEKTIKRKLKNDEILTFIEKYSNLCNDFGFKMWGINLNSDKQSYREQSPFSTISVVLGPFSCFLKGNKCRYDERLPLKEDYDISIQNLNIYRGLLRVNKFHYVCDQATSKGGCACYRNLKREKEQLELLQKKWGNKIVKIDSCDRNHKTEKVKKFDFNPVINVPIKGV